MLPNACFAAECEEALGVHCTGARVDHRAIFSNNHGCSGGIRHHQGNVCTLGRVPQLCGGEDTYFSTGVVYVPAANDSDRFLLLENCLHIIKS